ncbi:phosphomevalonate kinase [Pichia californica]|uniref:phosphomevalonate kinase n=1 Tax=Pichia californica TaxID=460514 RepID=A0A9P6WP00_9ASCO|nr:phosphomevalonate kinase [[Candida] californica]
MADRAFSATGKAFLAGGYLVLDPQYEAYVVALSSRMYTLNNITENQSGDGKYNITVKSPQFLNGSWSYSIDLNEIESKGLRHAVNEITHKKNPFVESVVHTTIAYAIGKNVIDPSISKGKNIKITIFSDAEYHSQLNSIQKESSNKSLKFLYHNKEITKINKTGLGSSAALVTSLTASLLASFFPEFDIAKPELLWKEKVHNLSQISHCKAQGKIGSGFDVAAATFGSIIYRRFAPEFINRVLDAQSESIEKLVYLVDKQEWNMKYQQCSLPPGIRLLMGDVIGGSETPKMVSKVNIWREYNQEAADDIYKNLNESNMKLIKSLQNMNKLCESDPERYKKLLNLLSLESGEHLITESSDDYKELKDIIESIKNIRLYLQMMTVQSGAEIEPPEQSKLLDTLVRIRGVLGGVVPGAGGYDAVCILVSEECVEHVFSETASHSQFKHVRWMNLAEQKDGLVEEKPSDFEVLTNSRQSSSSIKSTPESLNDFLDLYADDDDYENISDNYENDRNVSEKENDRDEESDFETSSLVSNDHCRKIPTTSKNTNNINNSNIHYNDDNDNDNDNDNDCTIGENLKISQSQNQISGEAKNVSTISPSSAQFSTFKVLDSSVKTTIFHADSTIISDLDNTLANDTITGENNNNNNTTINSINRPKTYTYIFDDNSEDNLGIDESILDMINSFGNGMDNNEEIEIELSPDFISQLKKDKTVRQKSISNNSLNNMDLISIEMSTDDEDYDDANRFKLFFGMDSLSSSNNLEMSLDNDENHNQEEAQLTNEESSRSSSVPSENQLEDNLNNKNINNPEINVFHKHPITKNLSKEIEEDIQNLNISPAPAFSDFVHNTSIDFNNMPDDPPPYCEIDAVNVENPFQIEGTSSQSNTEQNISSIEDITETRDHASEMINFSNNFNSANTKTQPLGLSIKKSVNSLTTSPVRPSSSSSINSPMKRKISIKLKKNKDGELSRHASVDFYHMDRYLPPYRSLINPNKAFDYRTNTYIDANDNDIEIREGDDNKPIVAIHKRKKESKFMSILLSKNNNIKQKLSDETNDSLKPIKSRSVSIRSLTSITRSIKSHEMKSKPVAKFNDLSTNIHQMIIKQIDNQHDLVNCLYVSKEFKKYAIPQLYKYPKFTSSYRLGQFVHTIMNYPDYSQYVKIFDLSTITFPVSLTNTEILKYQNKLSYGSSSAMELLNDKSRIIYASWRDWKYRNHSLYGDFNKWRKRTNSSSTISSLTTTSNNSGVGIHWDINTNKSAPNLLDSKHLSSTVTLNSNNNNNNTGTINTYRTRSYSGSENVLKKNSRSRSNSASNIKIKSNGNNSNSKKNNKQQIDNGNFVKSFKKAFGIEPEISNGGNKLKKKRTSTSPIRKSINKNTNTTTVNIASVNQKKKTIPIASSMKNVSSSNNGDLKLNKHSKKVSIDRSSFEKVQNEIPFGTPHPKMNSMLKQYCFSKDIPAGYIIHILKECKQLEEINFNNIVVSNDYEIRDYEQFDWFEGTGKIHENNKEISPIILNEEKPIFWSDCNRDMDVNEDEFLKGFAENVDFKNIWKCLKELSKIRVLKLENLSSLEMRIIEGIVLDSEFKDNLQYLDCCKSGMVKRSEWDYLKDVNDWREYLISNFS